MYVNLIASIRPKHIMLLRDLLENGFEVAIVPDATAGPRHPTRGDGYQAALINYAFLAHAVVSTEETVSAMSSAG